ncbi:pentapeptide repeat-containing protein [Streptomyces sp. NPDC003362]
MTQIGPADRAPSWPYCGHGADLSTHPHHIGCRGIKLPNQESCLAHASETLRNAYLETLTPGANIDHRGTTFNEGLLRQLLSALTDHSTGQRRIGKAEFYAAQFSDAADFTRTKFTGKPNFTRAHFKERAFFDRSEFSDGAWFRDTTFSSASIFNATEFTSAAFTGAVFHEAAYFQKVRFNGNATFSSARFDGLVNFSGTYFSQNARMDGVLVRGNARFDNTTFTADTHLGPLACRQNIDMSGAVFEMPATLELSARRVSFERTRWESTATVRLRYASVYLDYAVLSAPVAITAHGAPFRHTGTVGELWPTYDESLLEGRHEQVRIMSIQGVDAAHLVLADTDLTLCTFSGSFHLDQIRLEGRITFLFPPKRWHRGPIVLPRTRRRTLAEEHHWRALSASEPRASDTPRSPSHWLAGLHHPNVSLTPGPEDVASLYRQLRKAFEDGKNEPGAADFYYGECEMRRHDRTGTSKGERFLLWGYWLLSGYGLRASRAFGWLIALMSLTVLLLMGFGLPNKSPDPTSSGALHGSKISLTTSTPDPVLRGGWSERMTWSRAEKATRVAVNSVVFRSSGQNLTTWGTYIEMASRLLEPVLLALGVLAVRGRIKR